MTILNSSSIKPQNPLMAHIREDIPARFNEVNMMHQQWPRVINALRGNILPPYEVLIHPSSACNLCCVWCIGDHIPIRTTNSDGVGIFLDAAKTNPYRLPDNLADPESMLKVMKGIIDYKRVGTWTEKGQEYTSEFKVENVSFSGLIGEPLVCKKAVIRAMRLLVNNGLRVGIFTNGVLMDESTWDVLVDIAYIHLSLDASNGETYGKLKFGGRKNGPVPFNQALHNLAGLVKKRDSTPGSTLDINASFILYPENYIEVYDAAKILKDIGVEYFRLKQDNSGQRLLNAEQRKEARDLLDRMEVELVDERFKLVRIHHLSNTKEMTRTFSKCIITDLMAAIGSDGHLYPCNYHPRPGAETYGSAIDKSFREIWEGEKRMETKKCLPHICPAVCDPFKNRSNRLLNTTNDVYHSEGLQKLETRIAELWEI